MGMNTPDQRPLELWGGVECTLNRVGDRYSSQLARNGHRTRLSDLNRFAELGLRTLRFPILWEELADDSLGEGGWRAIDAQLSRMRELGIKPIAGLVHHGSGPRDTSLIDPRFPEKLATFARRVAERYPWIDAYTPVNEPLTTARFSGLYGHWFPHGRDGFTFVRALLNQLRGVVLAMRAIRSVNPTAALVQTDDLGKTFASPKLQYQADFENERRWISWDLLCGRVDRSHPMRGHLVHLGADERDVDFFRENLCPPEVIGINHYITSERYLDEHLRDHPVETHGGNGRDRYADVAAVRARAEGTAGPTTLLREASDRYDLPVAVTEAHLGCTREEQLRWLGEVWNAAQTLRDEDRDIRAVTAWSLLGAFDWDSLLTTENGRYEPGAFDLRSDPPRPTAVARMIQDLAHNGSAAHPVLQSPGWWRRDIRLHPSIAAQSRSGCPSDDVCAEGFPKSMRLQNETAAKILITGAGGTLAAAFASACEVRGLSSLALRHAELNVADGNAVANAITSNRIWAVINCAGFSRIDEVENAPEACRTADLGGAEALAHACREADIPIVTFSSDHVFEGSKGAPYLESDRCHALNVLGETKIAADRTVLAIANKALVIRPGQLLAPESEIDWLRVHLQQLAHGERVRVADDEHFSVSYLPQLVGATLDLLIDGETGVWHLTNDGIVTANELLARVAAMLQLEMNLIEPVPSWSLHRPEPRARMRGLSSQRARLLEPIDVALQHYCRELPPLLEELEPAVGGV